MDATVEFPLNRRILGLFFASIQQGVRPGLLLLAGVVVVCCGGLFQLFPAELWRAASANDARQGEREVVRAESRALVRLPQPGMGLASYGVPSLVQQMVANQLSTPRTLADRLAVEVHRGVLDRIRPTQRPAGQPDLKGSRLCNEPQCLREGVP